MSFKLSKEQAAEREALAALLRKRAAALNIAIAAFNRGVEPFAEAVAEAQNEYNEILETARTLAGNIAEVAQEEFDAKSERWQEGEKGVQVRSWIEQWQMRLDDIDLELPEALTEIDPEEQAGELEDAPARPMELEHVRLQ
jgi:chromosome segregation ATPase